MISSLVKVMNKVVLGCFIFLTLSSTCLTACKSRQVSLVETRLAEQSFSASARCVLIHDTCRIIARPLVCDDALAAIGSIVSDSVISSSLMAQVSGKNKNTPLVIDVIRNSSILDSTKVRSGAVDTVTVLPYHSTPSAGGHHGGGSSFFVMLKKFCAAVFVFGFLAVIVKLLPLRQKS